MLTNYTYAQALRMYRSYGVRVAVPLSAAALRKARVRATTQAGLRELQVVAHPLNYRAQFQSDTDFNAELNAMRVFAHNVPGDYAGTRSLHFA